MTLAEMAEELRRTGKGHWGARGFARMQTPPRKVATLLAKSLREQSGPFVLTMGCYREEEREQMAAALDAGQLDDVLSEILAQEAAR